MVFASTVRSEVAEAETAPGADRIEPVISASTRLSRLAILAAAPAPKAPLAPAAVVASMEVVSLAVTLMPAKLAGRSVAVTP